MQWTKYTGQHVSAFSYFCYILSANLLQPGWILGFVLSDSTKRMQQFIELGTG